MPRRLARIAVWFLVLACGATGQSETQDAPPNVIFILADDLGYGELGCYGQDKIHTPNLDRLATEGLRFTRHYAGAPVCAPSRCVLMTGRALSHAYIRGNREVKPEGQFPIPDEIFTVGELMKQAGYVTGAIGKWGLGPPDSSGAPNRQGFDLFYGYNCQREAHNYYPGHLWLNGERQLLDNPPFRAHQKRKEAPGDYGEFLGNQYAPDLMASMALAFIREHRTQPFFLYLPFVEPHLAMQPPQEWVDRYPRHWDENPYLGQRGYLPHPRPRAGYAAMISHLDDHVGRVVALLDELDLSSNTLVIFSSDNGPTHDVGGVETEFFNSAGPLRGRKGSVYEGGLRVPMIARWPGRIAAGGTTDHVSAFQDFLSTVAELTGQTLPSPTEGISYLPTLLGREDQQSHDHLVWEFFEYGGQQAVIQGRWKAIRQKLHKRGLKEPIQLFDLDADPGEKIDLSADHPDIVARLEVILLTDRSPNPNFRIDALDD